MKKSITEYWATHYVRKNLCSICGNLGMFNTKGVMSAAGVECGDLHYCICPNGQAIRKSDQKKLKIIPK